jgi:hypothetical protein
MIAALFVACAPPAAEPLHPVAAPAVSAPPPVTFFMGARKGDDLVVLSYETSAGALRPFGPPLPLQTPPPGYAQPRFFYVFNVRPDRVFVVVDTFAGPETFAGDGTRWISLAPAAGSGLHPHVSDDGTLILVTAMGELDGQTRALYRVMTWDGVVVDQWPYQERAALGFVEHGRAWVTQSRADDTRLIHAPGEAPRAHARERVFDPQAGGTGRDRFVVKHGAATDRRTGEVVARFAAAEIPGARGSISYLVGAASSDDRGTALMRTIYTGGSCGDHECAVAAALDFWTFDDLGERGAERLFLSTRAADVATGQATLAPSGSHALWFLDRHTLATYDAGTGSRATTIATDYELVLVQSPRR